MRSLVKGAFGTVCQLKANESVRIRFGLFYELDVINFSVNKKVRIESFLGYLFWQVPNPKLSYSDVCSALLSLVRLDNSWNFVIFVTLAT